MHIGIGAGSRVCSFANLSAEGKHQKGRNEEKSEKGEMRKGTGDSEE